MEGKGYWFKEGTFLDLDTKKHIDFINSEPGRFGLSRFTINETYKKHQEKIPSEGKAREDLIIMAMKNGWVRIRHYLRPKDYWSIQCYDFQHRREDVKIVLTELLRHKVMFGEDAVVLSDFANEITWEYSSREGGVSFALENLFQWTLQ